MSKAKKRIMQGGIELREQERCTHCKQVFQRVACFNAVGGAIATLCPYCIAAGATALLDAWTCSLDGGIKS